MLRREGGYVLKGALDFGVEGERNTWGLKRTGKRQVGNGWMKVDFGRRLVLPFKVDC